MWPWACQQQSPQQGWCLSLRHPRIVHPLRHHFLSSALYSLFPSSPTSSPVVPLPPLSLLSRFPHSYTPTFLRHLHLSVPHSCVLLWPVLRNFSKARAPRRRPRGQPRSDPRKPRGSRYAPALPCGVTGWAVQHQEHASVVGWDCMRQCNSGVQRLPPLSLEVSLGGQYNIRGTHQCWAVLDTSVQHWGSRSLCAPSLFLV